MQLSTSVKTLPIHSSTQRSTTTAVAQPPRDQGEKVLSWGKMTLKPGEKVTRSFTVKVFDEIPATARGTSRAKLIRLRYDQHLRYQRQYQRPMCEAPKVLEATVAQLPRTGPGENMLFAGVLGSVVTFFYARTRQLSAQKSGSSAKTLTQGHYREVL
jgi:hypothetical protein